MNVKLDRFYRVAFCAGTSLLITANNSWCQDNIVNEQAGSNLRFNGFLDAYAAHDFNDPFTSTRPYTTQAFYEDETRVNMAMADVNLKTEEVTGRFALQAGDSVKSNYAAEKDRFWRYIQEMTAMVKLSDRLSAGGGIYFSHLGIETFNSRDNWTYTRSLVAEFSPYYETGGKLVYQVSDSLTAGVHMLRGWQNISSSAEPMYGLQLNYTPVTATQFTYANCLGQQFGGFRNFHDFIVKQDITDSWSAAAQFDFGTQGREDDSTAAWHGWALLTKYQLSPKVSLGGRVERFYDPHEVVVTTLTGNSFNVTGLSLNLDYEISKGLLWRTEYRTFIGANAVFPENNAGKFSASGNLIVTSLSYSFDIADLSL